ncbi:uncharacterized protein LOC124551143 isoform X1 [Schistocerca americana]|uniref:uncharacterized protein LOC124551143 isoform X1 n=1 Tax=Schistocerca americana TaxID=7009 RepID=UPI001F4FEA0F|nr:uncharacterized protein LOC124551143 isoform X1 [Schistocerca americana]
MGDSEKGSRKAADEFDYEVLVTVLVFLRCLRKELPEFKVTCNAYETSMFNDVCVIWSGSRCKYALFVQLKHIASKESEPIKKVDLFSSSSNNKSDFNINKYHDYYKRVEKSLRDTGIQYSLVVSTNVSMHENAWDYFDERETDALVGAELLHTGGCIFELDPVEVKNNFDPGFMERFFMFCGQKGVKEIRGEICKELKQLLGSGAAETNNACKELCECVKKWKKRLCTNPENLTCSWSEWKDIENKYKSSFCTIS